MRGHVVALNGKRKQRYSREETKKKRRWDDILWLGFLTALLLRH